MVSHGLQKLFIIIIGAFLTLLAFLPPTLPVSADSTDELLVLLNAARNDAGMHGLNMNSQLVAAAQRHSNDMANGDFLSHTGSDGSSFSQRITEAGYRWNTAAENVLYRFDDSALGAFTQWWNSAGHRNNMMNDAYCDIGIAKATSSSGRHYFTMVLARAPRQDCTNPVPPPSNGILNGTITLQGGSTSGVAVTIEVYQGSTLIDSGSPVLDGSGSFSVGNIPDGTYTIWIKHDRFLAVSQSLTIPAGTMSHNFGSLLAGDANNDNQVTLLDFSILSASFNRTSQEAGFDSRADFNGDGAITLQDFSLMTTNFNQAGAARP